jgi:hypothetical protein
MVNRHGYRTLLIALLLGALSTAPLSSYAGEAEGGMIGSGTRIGSGAGYLDCGGMLGSGTCSSTGSGVSLLDDTSGYAYARH